MNLTIEFTDGSRESFRFQKRSDAEIKVVSRIEKMCESQVLMLSMQGEIRIFPMANIKCARFSPVPANAPIPDFAILGAEPIG